MSRHKKILTHLPLGSPILAVVLCALAAPASGGDVETSIADAPVRGIVKPVQQATLASELQARVAHLPLREGERFEKGALLAEFDCTKYQSELEVAEAEYRAAIATRDSNRKLLQLSAAGRFEVEVAEAQAQKAEAAVAAAGAVVDNCRIHAPFAGRILDLMVHEHDVPGVNGALMKIADDVTSKVELIVPSNWLRWLKPGIPFTLELDDTGAEIAAKVRQIGAAVDAVSQTIKLTAVITEQNLDGVTFPA